MKLHELSPAKGATKARKRVGRGPGSGTGKTSGRGHKGLKARSGHHGGTRPGFEGGQMPLIMRLPKRGFVNIFRTEYATVNLSDLDARFENGSVVDEASLKEVGLVKNKRDGIKILGNGDITKKLTVKATSFSKSAEEKITQAGGKAEVI